MRRLLFILGLLGILMQAFGQGQDTTRYLWNPVSGNWDYISQVNAINDSTINYGTNNTVSADTLNGAIGHGNIIQADRSMAIGYNNTTTRANNLLLGSFTEADSTYSVTIGRGLSVVNRLKNSKYGSIGLGYFATEPVMYVQSGYEAGETYVSEIGGVSIGGPGLDTLTALQINEHLTGDAYFLKCKKWVNQSLTDVFTVDYDGDATLTGTLTTDSVICTYTPTIYQAAGDTSNYNTPVKIGDMFIDTSAGKTYISVGASRGDWVILNNLWPLIGLVAIRRRKRI